MAVKYIDIKRGISETPLNEKELSIIAKVESFIDKKIETEFDNNDIWIDPNIIVFKFDPITKQSFAFSDIKDTRKALMSKELMNRYEKAGWEWKYYTGEDDGPNRPAMDYWLLRGKL